MNYLGCDPGQTGAIALLFPNSPGHADIIQILPVPLSGKEIDVDAICKWINGWLFLDEDYPYRKDVVAYIEKVHSMPGQGVSSSFKFGFNTGILHGIIRTLGIPLYTVTPQAWKKEILAGTDKSKEAAIDYCRRVYPDVSLLRTERSRVYDNNIADAICIAEYGKRKHNER